MVCSWHYLDTSPSGGMMVEEHRVYYREPDSVGEGGSVWHRILRLREGHLHISILA